MPKATNPNPNPCGKSPVICEYCDKKCRDSSSLKIHRRVHTGERPFPCNLCSYSATQKGDLQLHIRRHLQEKQFKCPEPLCNYSSVTAGNLKIHRVVHTGEKQFSCSFSSCSYKTGRKHNLSRHEQTHKATRDRVKPFQCELCPFKATSQQHLKSHTTSIHSSERKFKCEKEGCKYAGKTKADLNKHAQVHQEKRLRCLFSNSESGSGCEYRTNQKSGLQQHMNVHSEDKKYKCPLCKYAGKHAIALTTHMRTHTKESPFKCPQEGCSFAAKQIGVLNRHVQHHQRH